MLEGQRSHYCVVGLGVTGISCLDFLVNKKNIKITATDVQNTPELSSLIIKYSKKVEFFLGELKIPNDVDFLILSPGIDPNLDLISKAKDKGITIINDLSLFLEQIKIIEKTRSIKIVAVTGTNGKTTVVNILSRMASRSGIKHVMCGNVGNPVLNALNDQDVSLYIIELSSFQLELTTKLCCDVACILNVTPDHLDRYSRFEDYRAAKNNIYLHAKNIVYFREDPNTYNDLIENSEVINSISFGTSVTKKKQEFGLSFDCLWLTEGEKKILAIKELSLPGEHNVLNALACLAIGKLVGFKYEIMCEVLRTFTGLEHRCQLIGQFSDGVTWYNDSKGTNVGATMAAINNVSGYSKNNKIIIILGGVNKKADLSILKPFLVNYCKFAILIGECKYQLLELFTKIIKCYIAKDLCSAVNISKKLAVDGDIVLLSPACASFDMFNDYKHRGELFKKFVLELYDSN